MVLEVEDGSAETDSDQQELEPRVDLGDGGGLDGGGGQGGVQVLLDGEGRHHAHVPDVEAGVHQEEVPGDDEAGERGRDEVGVSEGQVHTAWKHKLRTVHRPATTSPLLPSPTYQRVFYLTKDPGSCPHWRPGF